MDQPHPVPITQTLTKIPAKACLNELGIGSSLNGQQALGHDDPLLHPRAWFCNHARSDYNSPYFLWFCYAPQTLGDTYFVLAFVPIARFPKW